MFGRRTVEVEAETQESPQATPESSPKPAPGSAKGSSSPSKKGGSKAGNIEQLSSRQEAAQIRQKLFERLDPGVAIKLQRANLKGEIERIVIDIAEEERMSLSSSELRQMAGELLDDMVGVGPIEPLLADDSVTDILVNGPNMIFVERRGKLELTGLRFRDDIHVRNVAQRIAAAVGRRIDESSPMVDARLPDGSRVNVIIPPLAIDGASISIRKFSKRTISFDQMAQQGNMSPKLARLLEVASASRLNIIVSGGTGSGKTTMLNALSQLIDEQERIVTIEDAAELKLQQPHVVRLETRPPNTEGKGNVSMRHLVKNALRMRPDRIICGEVRGEEAFDMLQAMNTGHDGSMSTVHANNPRDALARLENMLLMANGNLPSRAIRGQIVSAVDIIVQMDRMRDGMRRCIACTEVVGMEGDVIITQDLFTYEYESEGRDGTLLGKFVSAGTRPHFLDRARYYGFEEALLEAMS